MFQKLNVPILGLVENMSYHLCPKCGHREEIFGHGGARAAAKKLGFPFLGEIPLDVNVRVQSDSGKPVALDGSTPYGKAFQDVAAAVAKQVETAGSRVDEGIQIE
jgi:ATP-binding protein involved in chromosome partitioning